MNKFAFVIHPLDIPGIGIAFNEPNIISKKASLVKKTFEWLPSFKCSDISGIDSDSGQKAEGYLIYCTLLPEQIISLDSKLVLNRVVEAGMIAKDLGANIIGLGAYVAQVGKKGVEVAKAVGLPVTTGTHYTIYIAIESVIDAVKRVGLKIEDCTVAVIGATGAIGRVCAQVFAEKAGRLILVGRNEKKLHRLTEKFSESAREKTLIEVDIKKALKISQVSIMATTTPTPLIDIDDLDPGSIVCDISRPRNISHNRSDRRQDVLVIDGGIVKPPGKKADFNFYLGIPDGLAYACLAETMILALEGRYESYSIGGKVSLEKVMEIGALGKKHGFKLAKIRSFNDEVSPVIFSNLRKIHSKKKK